MFIFWICTAKIYLIIIAQRRLDEEKIIWNKKMTADSNLNPQEQMNKI